MTQVASSSVPYVYRAVQPNCLADRFGIGCRGRGKEPFSHVSARWRHVGPCSCVTSPLTPFTYACYSRLSSAPSATFPATPASGYMHNRCVHSSPVLPNIHTLCHPLGAPCHVRLPLLPTPCATCWMLHALPSPYCPTFTPCINCLPLHAVFRSLSPRS